MRVTRLVAVALLVGCSSAPGGRSGPPSDGVGGTSGASGTSGATSGAGGTGRLAVDAAAGAGGSGDSGGSVGAGGNAGSGGTGGNGASGGPGGAGDSDGGGGRGGAGSDRDAADEPSRDAERAIDAPAHDLARRSDLASERAAPTPDVPAGADPEPGRLAGITRFHNAVRAKIPVPPLTWDPSIAATAAAYAAMCKFEHSGTKGLGENLAAYAPGGTEAASAPVDDWAGEVADYDYATNSCAPGKDCGHYTQLVWKTSQRLGCAVQSCTVNSPFGAKFPKWDLWVCNYSPPGNFVGERPY